MMLSRVAERVYWMARYLERTENTARLINVHTSMMMDLPKRMEINWFTLIHLFNADEIFHERYKRVTEENIMQFLIADRDNPVSLASSLFSVRENVRTSLDLLPDETWQQVNQAHIQLNNALDVIGKRHTRLNLLRSLQRACQCINGVIDSYMSRDHTFDFMQAGRQLERADMSSRILEMASLLLSEQRSETLRKYEGILWTNLLQALSARQMYQQHVQPRVRGREVLKFLVLDEGFPRSLRYSLVDIGKYLGNLPEPELTLAMQNRILAHLKKQDLNFSPDSPVHALMDHLQGELGKLHAEISRTWFHPDRDGQMQSQ
ncbi:MAG: alpha-E domain-containing protein [Thiothrix sp.]|nr:alpha-E domain-containing protein [Thiothrix sp.]HPQ95829.1 alpha-E domain-containing protein [Thiolinea sp.]